MDFMLPLCLIDHSLWIQRLTVNRYLQGFVHIPRQHEVIWPKDGVGFLGMASIQTKGHTSSGKSHEADCLIGGAPHSMRIVGRIILVPLWTTVRGDMSLVSIAEGGQIVHTVQAHVEHREPLKEMV